MSGLALRPRSERGPAPRRRFSVRAHGRAFWIALAACAVAAELAALAPVVLGDESTPAYRVVFRLIGGSFMACGIIAWHRRPDSRSGLLMVLTGLGLFVEPLFVARGSPTLHAIGDMFEDAWGITMIALLLTTLTGGRLYSRLDRVLVGAFVLQLVIELARHLFLEQDGNFLLVHADAGLAGALNSAYLWLISISCLAVAGVIGARWMLASGPRRRAMLPAVAGILCLLFFAVAQQASPTVLRWLAVCSLLAVPAGFLVGLLRSKLARGGLADLLRELGALQGAALQARIAKVLGDRDVVLAYRAPGAGGYVDADGRAVTLPGPRADRAVAPIAPGGRTSAALVYDAALDDDPELIEAVCGAAAVAIENHQLQEQAQARLAELRASRERIVAAGDAERRRLERNLHDGAQQRLVALAMHLQRLQQQIRNDPMRAEEAASTASAELAGSLAELRELARGIHPAVLDYGLCTALETLVTRCAVPVRIDYDAPERLPAPVELAAYFVVSEALTNIAKYAHATSAAVRVSVAAGVMSVEIADDGVGGADPAGGSGLRGLGDRVEALDGRLSVVSPPGGGTLVTAELPCA